MYFKLVCLFHVLCFELTLHFLLVIYAHRPHLSEYISTMLNTKCS